MKVRFFRYIWISTVPIRDRGLHKLCGAGGRHLQLWGNHRIAHTSRGMIHHNMRQAFAGRLYISRESPLLEEVQTANAIGQIKWMTCAQRTFGRIPNNSKFLIGTEIPPAPCRTDLSILYGLKTYQSVEYMYVQYANTSLCGNETGMQEPWCKDSLAIWDGLIIIHVCSSFLD